MRPARCDILTRASAWRPAVAAFAGAVAVVLLAGCAPQNPAITAKPTPAELPDIPPFERTIPVAVAVEGQRPESRVHLVPDFKEPELTADEKQALGIEPIRFKFLPYSDLAPPVGSSVGPWYARVETAADNYAPIGGVYETRTRSVGVLGTGEAMTGRDRLACRVSGSYAAGRPAVLSGPPVAIVVETDTAASSVAGRKPRDEP